MFEEKRKVGEQPSPTEKIITAAEALPVDGQEPPVSAPRHDLAQLEALAWEIQKWLRSHEMWQDVCIYYGDQRMSTFQNTNGKTKFRYNGEPFIEEGFNPKDYCEYANPDTITMTFEGPLYDVLNWNAGEQLEQEFCQLIHKYGFYYEMGYPWSLSLYEV